MDEQFFLCLNLFQIITFVFNMIKYGLIILIFSGLIVFSNCKKEDDWNYCEDCNLGSWVGEYSGTGNYYSDTEGSTEMGVPVVLTIENSDGNVLKTKVTVEDRFMLSFISTKNDSSFFYEISGTSKSLSLSLSKKGSEFKLSGTSKTYHIQSDTTFIDHSISFEVFR
jgi:hypothetical protein